ncbi:Ig-like domain-containing protein [Stutzerimonas stutzeri]|uniref:Ig-like domain-containing protein n=1 Tax=Stutzerimonas stutzeri TaxID=316 RepID=UPI002108AC66|nr:Ig-like domain-containing protein [Stutzerimonas stutzeri]MCQ4240269.1 Ig-like domain-containing protein [Stutzerimonas stutzeri]
MFWNKKKTVAAGSASLPARSPLASALEPRMMFDGAVAATVADTAISSDIAKTQAATDTSLHASNPATPPVATSAQRQEVVFIDNKVNNHQQLLSSLKSGTEVVLVDGSQNGLQQIADYLQGRTGIDAIHILSHGSAGTLHLGDLVLTGENLDQHSKLLTEVGNALSSEGDILLYGCDIAADRAGMALINGLAAATEADVMASSNATGSGSHGGDWILEQSTGAIEAATLSFSVDTLLALPNGLQDVTPSTTPGNFLPGFNLTANYHILGTDNPEGIYLNINEGGYAAHTGRFTVSADESNVGTFDLTALSLSRSGYGTHVFIITGYKADGSTITTTFEQSASGNVSGGNYTSFTNITRFEIAFKEKGELFGVRNVLFDSFSVANATAPLHPNITSATYDASTGVLSVAGTDMRAGDNISTSKLRLLGEGGASYTLTSGTVQASSATGFSVVLNTADRAAIGLIFNRNGSSSTGGSTFGLAAASGWDASRASAPDETGNVVTVSNVPVPTISSSTYDAATGTLTVSGSGFTQLSGASNDIIASKFTVTGQAGATYTLTDTANVEITSGTSFTLTLSATDRNALQGLLNRNGTSSTGGTTYNLAAAEDWLAGADAAAVVITDMTGNGITVSNANSAPVANNDSYSLNEDSPLTVSSVLTNDTDADGNALSASLVAGPAHGTLTFSDNGTFTYTPSANYYGTDSFTYRAHDGLASSNVATVTLTITAVNDAPVLTTSGGGSTFTENGSAAVIDSGLTLIDVDNATLASATAAITGNFASGQDLLLFVNDGSSMGNISASYDAGTGVLTLTSAGASATLAQWQAALRSITYSNGSDAPSTATRTISFRVNDGTADSNVATTVLNVTAVNDAPQITAPPILSVTEDQASALTGISFTDPDAAASTVVATFSVSSGSLAATSGGAVTVGGTSSALTLTGSLANINAYIAASNLSFTTAANATSAVTLTVTINDGGNTGNGGTLTDSKTATLQVTAINDAPTVANPIADQSATEDQPLNFQFAANTFADVEGDTLTYSAQLAGGSPLPAWLSFDPVTRTFSGNPTNGDVGPLSIQVTADDGQGGTVTDTFDILVTNTNDAPSVANPISDQNATEDAAFSFQFASNTFSDMDAGDTLSYSAQLVGGALPAWLSFDPTTRTFSGTPTTGDAGTLSINVIADDGNGGSVSDTFSLTVNSPPRVTAVTSSASDGSYRTGETLTISITFNQAVTVNTAGGSPTLLLETGALDRNASYVSGSGTDTLTFSYTVQAGDISADLNYQSTTALALNGASLTNAAGNAAAALTLPSLGSLNSLAGQHALTIDGVRPTAAITLADTTLSIGETTTVTITFSEAVSGLTIADFTVANGALSNLITSDNIIWTATFTPDANVESTDNLITLDNTGYSDAAGNAGTGTTDSNNYAIDTQRPTATIVVSDTALAIGEASAVTITFNEAVTGLSLADFSVASGTLSNLSTADNITWTATLTPNGNITDSSNVITLNNTSVQDAAGNAGSGTTASNNYAIDAQRPTATIQLSDTALAAGETATVTITFNEAVTGLMLADLSATNGSLSGLGSNDGGITWTATLTPAANATASSNLITLNNAAVQDAAGNAGIGVTQSSNYVVDTVVPLVSSVSVPAGVQYNAGDTLTFVVNASEAVLVNGTPRLALDIGGSTVYADYVAGSGTTTLVFQYSLQPGLNDTDGITVAGLQDNGGSLRDATGNAMNLTLNNVGDTSGVRVDTIVPSATIALDPSSSATNVRYTVTFSEDVSGVDLSDFSLVTSRNASGILGNLVQIDARTYQITITNIIGSGSLALALNSSGTGISDSAGNMLADSLVGQPYTLSQGDGDPEFRANPTPIVPTTPSAPPQPTVPSAPPSSTTSPLLPPPLFEQPTLGSGVPTVGNIFINNGALAPSFIAQVFASSDSGAGNGSGIGFLGFGGNDGGVFGTSSFSSVFSKDVPLESGDIQLRWGNSISNGLSGGEILGAPTLSQQLQEIGESEQRQIKDLAWALGKMPLQMPQA